MKNVSEEPCNLSLLAQVVGGRFDTVVVEDPHSTTFSTDGINVRVPSLIAGGQKTAVIVRGGIAHEAAGHNAHTDFPYRNKWIIGKSPLANALSNIIEDSRSEKAASREYPGCRKILNDMVVELAGRGFFSLPDDAKDNPAAALTSYINRALRAEEQGQSIDAVEAQKAVDAIFGKALRKNLLEIAKIGSRAPHTSGACDAADAIIVAIREAVNPQPPPPPEQKQDKHQEKGDETNEGGQPQNSAGQAEQDGDSEQALTGSQASDDAGPAEPSPQDIAQAAQKTLQATKADIGITDIGEMAGDAIQSEKQGDGVSALPGPASRTKAPHTTDAFIPNQKAAALSVRLQSRLTEHLRSRVEDEDDDETERGRLNPRRICRAMLGEKQVFLTEGTEGEGLNTAVFVLVDESGSMTVSADDSIDKSPEQSALAALYALSSAMAQYESQGVKFAISSFGKHVKDLKDFGQPWAFEKKNIGQYKASGGTRFTGALQAVLPDLILRKEKKKLMFVITDGDVGQTEINKTLCATARQEGVEVRVLLISDADKSASDSLKKNSGFFRVALAAPGADLQQAIFETLKDMT